MALNKYMHPRNIYKSRKPDFQALASKYDYFKEKVTVSDAGKTILEFKDPAALRVLTRALLEEDFGLVVTIPLDRLIPTVPQRLNYILWLEDIIGKDKVAKGIDIGTGSCCIYPLLGSRLNQWQFLASEIDDQNILFANKNISNNKLEEKITVKKVSEETILAGLVEENTSYDFCMCNPPFYSDHLEAQGISSSRNDDRSDASSVSTASEAECIAWGGEVRFVSQMIEESVVLKDKVRLYTSLLGKKTSLSLLKDVLVKNKITKYSTTEFCQGRTMRWGIAWTFDDNIQFPKSLFREKKNEKPPLCLELSRSGASVVGDYTVQAYTWYLWKHLEELKIYFHIKHSGKFYTCFYMKCTENTWSHQRRRKREKKRKLSESGSSEQISENTVQKVENGTTKESICLKTGAGSTNKDTVSKNTGSTKMDTISADTGSTKMDTISADTGSTKMDTISADTGSTNMETVSETPDDGQCELGEKRKRNSNDTDAESSNKKLKTENDETESNTERANNKSGKLELITSGGSATGATEQENKSETKTVDIDKSNVLNRKEIIEQFWKEQEANSGPSAGKKKVEKSFYECLAPFQEDEECLLLCRVILRKEEGVISLAMTHIAGNKEAMHQIMQYFKNKFTEQKKPSN